MHKFIILAIVLVVFTQGCTWQNSQKAEENTQVEQIVQEEQQVQPGIKEFEVSGNDFAFDVKEITVNQGDTVRINFTNSGGFHDLVIDEFNARTKQLADGGKETIEFVANQTGTFEYYCSVGKHRQMGMVGNLIVK
jgi:plastocyanin